MRTTANRRRSKLASLPTILSTVGFLGIAASTTCARDADLVVSPMYANALRGLATAAEPRRSSSPPATSSVASPGRLNRVRDDAIQRTQFPPAGALRGPGDRPTGGLSSIVTDQPISYFGPDPARVDDIRFRDGPQIAEPMVFDLVRGLGARQGELEVNVLNLIPLRRDGAVRWEWAPEIEYAVFDGFAVEFELPIFNTTIEATKYAAQYTFGTALDDAFIHGVQGILFHDIEESDVAFALLYLAGIRLDKNWSLFTMLGFNVGPQVFPFDDLAPQRGTDIIMNNTVFYDVSERLVLGVETNLLRRIEGSGDFLLMPQFHYHLNENYTLQFGVGMRDNVLENFPEIGFRLIWER